MSPLEQEVKLEVPPGWRFPDLDGVIPGARAEGLPTLSMQATYYDTTDLRLARQGVTLRFRQESEVQPSARGRKAAVRGEWTLKLPTPKGAEMLVRQEITWPAQSATHVKDRKGPHPEAAALVRALVLGRPLVPVALLATERQRVSVRTSDDRKLAEVDHDHVAGRRLSPGGQTASESTAPEGPGMATSFEELEVELSEGSSVEVLTAVVKRLRQAGAKPSDRVSKLKMVLGNAEDQAGPALTPGAVADRRAGAKPAVLAEVLQDQAAACLEQVLAHDIGLRLQDPDAEHVHRARVAVRRLRTVLRSFHRHLLSGPGELPPAVTAWLSAVSDELRWLGLLLGEARDADVRTGSIGTQCLELPLDDEAGAAALLRAAEDDKDGAHDRMVKALHSDRYISALRAVDALGRPGAPGAEAVPPQLWDRLTGPAWAGTQAMAHKEWRAVRKAVKRLGDNPSDDALHRVRVKAKRLRYLAEVAQPLASGHTVRKVDATVEAATALQDVLGDLHDAVVTEAWLRQVSARAQGPALSLAAGQLVAAARQRQAEGRWAWGRQWKNLTSDKTLSWLG